ncbi:MAG: TolC family protein [Flavobacteriaceae bacterium]
MKLKITVVLLLSLTLGLQAQQRKWTLQECVTYAVENNLSVQQFELDLEDAKIDKSDAIGNFLPTLNGQLNASVNTGLSFDPTSQEPVNATQFTSSGVVSSQLNIFDGLRNIHQFNRAKLNAIASQYRRDDLVDDIRLNVANSYLQVLSNKESLKVARAQYAVTEQDLIRTKELVESGVVPRGDLLEIEATAANQEQAIVNGESLVTIALINLAQLLQITEYENFDVADEEFEVPLAEILNNNPKEIFAKAMDFRNDIKFSQANVELAEKDLLIAKADNFPTLGAFFNYNTRYSDNFFDPVTGIVVPFENQLWTNDGVSFGGQVNIPVFNGNSTRNSIKRSKISLEKARVQFEQNKLDLETTINQAYVDVQSFGKAYEAAEKTLEARQTSLDYARERYEVGLMNAFDYGQAQARRDDAAADAIRTKYEYIFRIKILEFYFGLPIVLN